MRATELPNRWIAAEKFNGAPPRYSALSKISQSISPITRICNGLSFSGCMQPVNRPIRMIQKSVSLMYLPANLKDNSLTSRHTLPTRCNRRDHVRGCCSVCVPRCSAVRPGRNPGSCGRAVVRDHPDPRPAASPGRRTASTTAHASSTEPEDLPSTSTIAASVVVSSRSR